MLFSTIALSIGFFAYTQSSLNNLISFGLITGFTIIIALLADLAFHAAIRAASTLLICPAPIPIVLPSFA